jgi:hypothetical protein
MFTKYTLFNNNIVILNNKKGSEEMELPFTIPSTSSS